MRISLFIMFVLAAASGCNGNVADASVGSDGSGGGEDEPAECSQDSQCAAAGSDCCACPTYAIAVSDPAHAACEDVPCQPQTCSTDVRAACQSGTCVLACAAVACALTCDSGFQMDANGCLMCACAVADQPQCTQDTDCTRVAADCCGCSLGGSDTAVPNDEVQEHQQQLDCPQDPECPGVDSCPMGLEPACVQGGCALLPALPSNACGLTSEPGCENSGQCVLNADPDATDHGVGVCQAP